MERITAGTLRYAVDANKSLDEAAFFNIREQSTPNMTLAIGPGVMAIQGITLRYAGGNTSTFTAPTTNPRIDLICINSVGTLSYITGTEASSPSAPVYPADRIVIAEIYHRVGETSLKWKDDSTNGYLYRFCLAKQDEDFRDFVLGETMLSNVAVAIRTNDEKYLNIVNNGYASGSSFDDCYGNYRSCQTFLTSADCDKIKGVRLSFALGSSAQYNLDHYVELYAVDGSNNPTGSALATNTSNGAGHEGMNGTKHEVFFPLEYDCSANTTYAIVLRSSGTTTSDSARWYQATSSYADGTAKKSTDGGSSWTAQAYDYGFDVVEECIEDDITSGRIYKTDADYEGQRIENFVGMLAQSGSAGDTRSVQISGIVEGLSGLTAGDKYYLSNTAGEITNLIANATYPFEVGIAISATQLLLNPRKKSYKKSETLTGSGLSFDANSLTECYWRSFGVPIQAREGDRFAINFSININTLYNTNYILRIQDTTLSTTSNSDQYFYVGNVSGSYFYQATADGVYVISIIATGIAGTTPVASTGAALSGYLEVIKQS